MHLQGLWDGPRPLLLEACTTQELQMILFGNEREASQIEFGAHQVKKNSTCTKNIIKPLTEFIHRIAPSFCPLASMS